MVSRPWRRFVLGAQHAVDRRYYTFCTLERLQDALRRRDVFVAPSERWGDPRAKLLHGPGWETVRTQVCRTLGRSETAAVELEQLAAELNSAYQRTAAGLPANTAARIERTGSHDTLVLTGLDKLEEPATLLELRGLVEALLPRVDLPELLREGALVLENRKQKRGSRKQRVYVSTDLVAQLHILARDTRIGYRSCLFRSAKSGDAPMSSVHAWRIVTACSRRAGVQAEGADGALRPANARDFRHGAAVNQVRQGIPLSEVQQQLGHARIDSTTIYTKLANPERRRLADRVAW